MRLRCVRDAHQTRRGESSRQETTTSTWDPHLPSANANVEDPAKSPNNLLAVDDTEFTRQTKVGGIQRRDILPWEAFLSLRGNTAKWSGPRRSKAGDFKELLDEGKKRLERAEEEELLRQRAQLIGSTGSGALDDLLADLREPTFSRWQNEKLRQGIATRLRAKVARLYYRVMRDYFSGAEADRLSGGDDMARATAAFRVKLNDLLDPSRLGDIQDQVTREIAGVSDVPTARLWRECCKAVHQADRVGAKTPRRDGGFTSRSANMALRIHTADPHTAKPQPPTERESTVAPVLTNRNVRDTRKRTALTSFRRKWGTARKLLTQEGGKLVDEYQGSWSSNIETAEENRHSNGNADVVTPSALESPDEVTMYEHVVNPAGEGVARRGDDFHVSSVDGSTDASCSTSSMDFYDGLDEVGCPHSTPEQSSGNRGLWFLSAEDERAPVLGVPCAEGTQEQTCDERSPDEKQVQEEEHFSPERQTPKRRAKHRKSHRNRGRVNKGNGAGDRAADRGGLTAEARTNRSLTVLLTELGRYQSCQRTALSKYVPTGFKGGDGRTKRLQAPPRPRIDRPHFRPVFVNLATAGKGCTLLMCPEPVAPGYEYADVFEEVVKLHPPKGQHILEEIDRENIVTRSDALAHVEMIERGPVANQVQVFLDEFLGDGDVRNFLASTETLELDLAQCASAGTLFNHDDVP